MANQAHLDLLSDPEKFREKFGPAMDFSGATISFDFSDLALNRFNFSGCLLRGSKFHRVTLESCDFSGADWAGCDFLLATFNGGNLKEVRNADRALHLTSVKAQGFMTGFETAIRTGRAWPDWDWERLGTLGRLPLFGASASALILLPIYFYGLAHYNHTVSVVKQSVNASLAGGPASPLAVAIGKLPLLPIPSLSLMALISALFLALGSGMYSFFCPPVPKQFSLAQWRYQLEESALLYLAQAWTHRWIRIFCAWFYLIGGALGLIVLAVKLYQTATYIIAS